MVQLLLIAGFIFGGAAHGLAQGYPTKPVRMLVGFPPGGPTDITARITADYLSGVLGQQVIVDNRPGAGGTLAATILARATPDGYTIALGANGEMAISPNLRAKLPYDPLKDFAPISRIGAAHLALVVHPGFAARSVRDLIALAKSKPGVINFASAGTGSTSHLASELLKTMAGIDIVHVPYKGSGPAMSDVMGGQVPMLITGYSAVVPHAKAGRLRVLAVTGPRRIKAVPELPTIGEAVPGYDVTSWYGIFAPAGTAQGITGRLQKEIAAMVRKAEVNDKLVALGMEPEGNMPHELAGQMKVEIAKWARVIKAAGVPQQ
ncbi:MAG: tripartite tricarboxylate transporter substrate binding protein [Betaproteobacteria bacterium]|nr:tripartite tricarboxylate transporter substrate binding protein [Betaproteobacteria bacterium]